MKVSVMLTVCMCMHGICYWVRESRSRYAIPKENVKSVRTFEFLTHEDGTRRRTRDAQRCA